MITIISATNRKESLTYKIAASYSNLLNDLNIENQIMDLCNLPSDFMFSNFNGASTEVFKNIVEKYIQRAEKFVVVSPEYHGSYPGIFKALIDCVDNEFIKGKKVALVGVATGRAGNLRGMEHLTSLFHHLKAEVLSLKPKLSEVHKLLGVQGEIKNHETVKLLHDQIDSFVKF